MGPQQGDVGRDWLTGLGTGWGSIGTADRLDFTAIGPAVNLVGRLEGPCKPLGYDVLISGTVAAETTMTLLPLGTHMLRGIAKPCPVFALPEG